VLQEPNQNQTFHIFFLPNHLLMLKALLILEYLHPSNSIIIIIISSYSSPINFYCLISYPADSYLFLFFFIVSFMELTHFHFFDDAKLFFLLLHSHPLLAYLNLKL
jgi:hypothetical protein